MDPYKPYRGQAESSASSKEAPRPNYMGRMDHWEQQFRQLQIRYEKFFNGAEAIPPEEMRNQLGNQLKMLHNARLNASETFRLGTLEARFNSYSELFNRRQRHAEEGKNRAAAAARLAEEKGPDPHTGITIGAKADGEAINALYAGLAQGERAPKFDLDSFGSYLERQATLIRRKTGCEKVQFRIEQNGDKPRLKAKPIRD